MGSANGYYGVPNRIHEGAGQNIPNGIHDKNPSPKELDGIAIIGLSCRFPGDATSPERFWQMCAEGRSAWTPIPEERFNAKAFYHPQGEKRNTTNVTGGHFLREDLALFDAAFFNMSSEVASVALQVSRRYILLVKAFDLANRIWQWLEAPIFLSPDGRSYAFDSRAAGYGRGEGVGTLVLKTHKAALRDGDPIRAIIRETGLNQDGNTPTITSPSQAAQEELIRRCYATSGIDPATVDYVEAHGTGTQAGDPIEAAAIDAIFGRNRLSEDPVYIGSVKTNIGHLEPASGLAAIIKVALALERGLIPPSINYESPNPKIAFEDSHLKVPTQLLNWPRGSPKRASVNNFGYGGTNSHVIMESSEIPGALNRLSEKKNLAHGGTSRIFLLSAKDETAAIAMVSNMKTYLRQPDNVGKAGFLDSLAYTLAGRRSHFDFTVAAAARDITDLIAALEVGKPVRVSERVPRLGFIFTGQGAQWMEEESRVSDAVLSPPLCVAIQIALVQLLDSWGITPTAVTSHSSGEIAAAFAAKMIDIREAMFILYSRGIHLDALRKKSSLQGGMLAVGLGRAAVEQYISEIAPHRLVVACVNSPLSVTVSGDMAAIHELGQKLSEAKVFARKLKVEVAYHSHHMKPLESDYSRALRKGLKQRAVRDVIYSSPVIGDIVPVGETLPSEHWVQNMLQPVLFCDSLAAMCVQPGSSGSRSVKQVDVLVEIGPHSALAGPARQVLASPALKQLNIAYKTRHWLEPRLNKAHRFRQHPTHDLLGSATVEENNSTAKWRHLIRPSEVPWVHDHRVQSEIIYPGAGFLCMAIQAMSQRAMIAEAEPCGYVLENIEILKALVVPNTSEGIAVQLALKSYTERDPGREGWYDFSISSVTDADIWTEHCKGRIAIQDGNGTNSCICEPFSREAGSFVRSIEPQDLFKSLRTVGIHHGPSFQNITRIQASKRQSISSFEIANTASIMPAGVEEPHVIHPTTLDSVFQAAYSALPNAGSKQSSAMVPRSIKRMSISHNISSKPGRCYDAQSTLHTYDPQGFKASVFVAGTDDTSVLALNELYCQSLGDVLEQEDESEPANKALTVHWAPDLDLNSSSFFIRALTHAPVASESLIVGEMRQACCHFIHDALEALTETDVQQLQWHHKAFYAWMKIQEQQSIIDVGVTGSNLSQMSEAEKDVLIDRVSHSSVDGQMACRIGKLLVPIFRQQVAPLEVMLDEKLLYDYYRQALRIDRSYEQIKQLLDAFAHQNPKAKVLEIGGGTGGCTVHALEVLGGGNSSRSLRFAQYDFTDISSGFFEMARERFAPWDDLVQYSKLDIEADPTVQGFQEGSYDLILACQVLHATKNMRHTLQNVRKLLRPGGKLMMIETTNDAIDIQLIFGTLPGWWLSEEPERKNSPSLNVDMWDQSLRATGFNGLDIQVQDCEDPHYVMSAMMATAADAIAQQYDLEVVIIPLGDDTPSTVFHDLSSRLSTLAQQRVTIENLADAKVDGKICLIIDSADTVLAKLDAARFESLRRLLTTSQHTFWVSRGASDACEKPFAALHTGILRTLRCENSQTNYVSLDLDPRRRSWTRECLDTVVNVFMSSCGTTARHHPMENEFSERDGVVSVARIIENERGSNAITDDYEVEEQLFFQDGRELRLDAQIPGSLDSLVFKDVSGQSEALPGSFVEINPLAFGLNFRDVMVALGQLDLAVMGLECSGVVTQVGSTVDNGLQVGDRANRVQVDCKSMVHIPEGMDFTTAASLPLVFTTAFYSLVELARLRSGETVLIHCGAGGVGQAAIMLAKSLGAEVFATAGSPDKRSFLCRTYGLPSNHVFSNRDSSFVSQIMRITESKGVEVVLNSLAGRLLQETWKCVAPFGRFVEIGKRDLELNHNLEMEPFTRNVSFMSVDMIMVGTQRRDLIAKMLSEIMILLQEIKISPVTPLTAMPFSDLQKAFRLLQSGKALGKICLCPGEEDVVKVLPHKRSPKLVGTATYVLVGGSGGLGRSIARLLVECGGRHLIILSRNAQSDKHVDFYTDLRAAGCQVVARNCNISDKADLTRALNECKGMPPVKGVIQGAMVLQDSIFERMSFEDYQTAVGPKVQGSWNLHEHFQDTPLDFFILLSSMTGVAGNSSQTNYAAGGSFQDALARYRSTRGLPAVSLDLGMVRSVGYVAETIGVAERMQRNGYRFVEEAEVMRLIESAILEPRRKPDTSQVMIGIASGPGADWGNAAWRDDPRFSGLCLAQSSNKEAEGGPSGKAAPDIQARLAKAPSRLDAVNSVCDTLVAKLAEMFSLPLKDIDRGMRLAKYGVDSLVAVELRNWLGHMLQAQLSIFEVMQSLSLEDLAEKVVGKSRLVGAELRQEV
ncbi:MAG: hypothetical protein Q9218_006357 [Villophora microphyllina]